MDFSNFDPTETVLITTVTDHEQDEDDPQAAPFVEENPCLVCGHKAYANFIDLSYNTSCTSQTAIPVKRKLKEILKKVWEPKRDNQLLCLACYDLVDRYDALEAQLNNIRENIEDKYQKTGVKKFKNGKTYTPNKKRGRQPGKGRKGQRKKEVDVIKEDDNDCGFEEHIDSDSDYSPHDEENHEPQDSIQDLEPVTTYLLPEVAEINSNVYDEHHPQLQADQRIRLGREHKDDNDVISFICGYCQQAWADYSSLHNHVHGYHQPDIVDVAIPSELGLGNTMNCGVEVQHCQEPPENPKPWSCLFCDASFRARTNMSSHFKDKHTPFKPFACADCAESFRKGIDLNRHKLYFCSQRTVTFAPKRKYKKRDNKDKSSPKKRPKEEDRCE